jgi:hypothetical protein
MSSTLRITKKLTVTTLFDIRHQEVGSAYCEGLYEHLHNRRQLVPVSYLVSYLQRSISLSVFDGQYQVAARDFVGYHIGGMHGTIIITGSSGRHDVATLAALDTNDAQRGYLACHHFFSIRPRPRNGA